MLKQISAQLQENTQAWNHYYNGPSGLKKTNAAYTEAKQAPLFTDVLGTPKYLISQEDQDSALQNRLEAAYTLNYPSNLANMGLPQAARNLNKQAATANLLSYTNEQHIEQLQETLNKVLAAQEAASKQRKAAAKARAQTNKDLDKITMILAQVYKGQYKVIHAKTKHSYVVGQFHDQQKQKRQQQLVNQYYNTHP